jgi:hypothetical protein
MARHFAAHIYRFNSLLDYCNSLVPIIGSFKYRPISYSVPFRKSKQVKKKVLLQAKEPSAIS